MYDPEADGLHATPPSTKKSKKNPEGSKEVSAVISKTIRDNFEGWSAASIDGTMCAGLTLRQT